MPEGFVIFDDVFVPNERIFLDGEVQHAAVFAHSLGLWERLGGLSAMAEDADQLVGFAQLIAEANGLAGEAHMREKISEMIIHATLIRAALEAAIANCQITEQGAFPDELYTNAGKYHGAANYNLMVRHLHDISGGSILTAPGVADLENEVTGAAGAQVHGHQQRHRRRISRAAVSCDSRPDRRRVRRMEGCHQRAGRRRALCAAHRHAQALRLEWRQAKGAEGGGSE